MSEQPVRGTGRHPDEDVLVEVAVGHTDASVRQEVSGHLAVCPGCRQRYDDVAGAVELVLPAAPRVAPPPGFEGRALAALVGARNDAGGGASRPPFRYVPRRTVLWAAAAAVLGLAAGAAATAYLVGGEEPDPWSAPLVATDGSTVGLVAHSYDDRGEVLVVEVTGGRAGATYTCRLRLRDGSTRDAGTWTLASDRPNSWVVPVGGDEVDHLEMVAAGGRTWASASL